MEPQPQNFTPFDFQAPTEGLFLPLGSFNQYQRGGEFSSDQGQFVGDTIYYKQGNKVYSFELTSLLTPEEKQSAGNFGGQKAKALTKFYELTGINPATLPMVDTGHLFRYDTTLEGSRVGGDYQPQGLGFNEFGEILKTASASGTTTQEYNKQSDIDAALASIVPNSQNLQPAPTGTLLGAELQPDSLGLTFEQLDAAGGEGAIIVAPDGKKYVITPTGTLRSYEEAVSAGAIPTGGAPASGVPQLQYVSSTGQIVATPQTPEQQQVAAAPTSTTTDVGTIGNTGTTTGATGTTTGTGTAAVGVPAGVDISALLNTPEFKALSPDEQEAVKAVFGAIVANNADAATQLEAAFRAATQLADPYFAQQIRLAADALQRGYVSIDNEEAFKEEQMRNALTDLQADIANKSEFLTLEEANTLRGIERQYKQTLDTTRQNLAATGFTFSSRRAETEQLLSDERGDLVESTERKFGFQQEEMANTLTRNERDTAAEIERLQQVAEEGRLELLRRGEAELGTANLPALAGATPLGGITGSIPTQKMTDIIEGTKNLIF